MAISSLAAASYRHNLMGRYHHLGCRRTGEGKPDMTTCSSAGHSKTSWWPKNPCPRNAGSQPLALLQTTLNRRVQDPGAANRPSFCCKARSLLHGGCRTSGFARTPQHALTCSRNLRMELITWERLGIQASVGSPRSHIQCGSMP